MSRISSARYLQILYFSRENKEIKNLKSCEKIVPISAFIHTPPGLSQISSFDLFARKANGFNPF